MKKIKERKVEMFLDENRGGVYVIKEDGKEMYRQDCRIPVAERKEDIEHAWGYFAYGE